MEAAHARFSPSGAHKWLRCPGSMVLEGTYPDEGSSYAKEGTAAHLIASMCLDHPDMAAKDHLDKEFDVEGQRFVLSQTHAEHIDEYVSYVREQAKGGLLLVEKRVNFSPVIEQPNSFGTSDAIIVHAARLTVVDLKYGMGVKVDAEDNEQLQLYALGAINDYGHLADFEEVRMVVHQPRLNHVSDWTIPVSKLEAFGETAKTGADTVLDAFEYEGADNWAEKYLSPGSEQCKFCRAKATCPALRNAVEPYVSTSATADEFNVFLSDAPGDVVADLMDKAEMAEMLIKAVRAEIERRLLRGDTSLQGRYKLVEGRKGNREWSDPAKVEELMKKKFRFKDDQVYDFKLISPTTAEKRFKDQVRRWDQLSELITRANGKPSVAPASDKRPAITVQATAAEFAAMVEAAE